MTRGLAVAGLVTIAAVFAAAGGPSEVERAELTVAAARLQQLAEPHLRVRPTDTPGVLAYRQRLAALVDFHARFTEHILRKRPISHTLFFNFLQVTRDTADAGVMLSRMDGTRRGPLAWLLAGYDISEKFAVVHSRSHFLDPPPPEPPAQLTPWRAQLELFRSLVVRELAQELLPPPVFP